MTIRDTDALEDVYEERISNFKKTLSNLSNWINKSRSGVYPEIDYLIKCIEEIDKAQKKDKEYE